MDWSNLKKDTFLSASWDGHVKVVSGQPKRFTCPLLTHMSSGRPNDLALLRP